MIQKFIGPFIYKLALDRHGGLSLYYPSSMVRVPICHRLGENIRSLQSGVKIADASGVVGFGSFNFGLPRPPYLLIVRPFALFLDQCHLRPLDRRRAFALIYHSLSVSHGAAAGGYKIGRLPALAL